MVPVAVSTARIRIELGPALMASSSFFSRRHRPARNRRFCICNGGWNGQSGLRTGIELAPDSQLTSDSPGAFVHCQASRSARPARLRGGPSGRWLSIVAEPQPKLPLAIRDFDSDATCVCVPECIAHCLDCSPVGLVPVKRCKVPRCAFHMHLKVGTATKGALDRARAIQRRCAGAGDVWKSFNRGLSDHSRCLFSADPLRKRFRCLANSQQSSIDRSHEFHSQSVSSFLIPQRLR